MSILSIGIDLGGTDIKGGLVSSSGEVVFESKISTEADAGTEHVLDRMAGLCENLKEKADGHKISGVGIGVPGQVIVNKGLLVEAPNLPSFLNIYVGQEMERRLDVPVVLDNDANVAALGEFNFGAGRGSSQMMMVTLGTGVGGGLIFNGDLFRGAEGGAGEFGHMILSRDGAICSCGRKGCVEAYVGTRGILRALEEKLNQGSESILLSLKSENITPKDISKAAESGDKTAKDVLVEVGEWLGVGIGSVANLLNLDRVVVGGGVAGAGELILASAREKVNEIALKVSLGSLEIVPAQMGNSAGLIGAACLVMPKGMIE